MSGPDCHLCGEYFLDCECDDELPEIKKVIINSERKLHVTVELSKKDISKLLNGQTVIQSTIYDKDEPTFVEVYCSEPDKCEYDE